MKQLSRVSSLLLLLIICSCGKNIEQSFGLKDNLGQDFLIDESKKISTEETKIMREFCNRFEYKRAFLDNTVKTFDKEYTSVSCSDVETTQTGVFSLYEDLSGLPRFVKDSGNVTNFFADFETDQYGFLAKYCSKVDEDSHPRFVADSNNASRMFRYDYFRGCIEGLPESQRQFTNCVRIEEALKQPLTNNFKVVKVHIIATNVNEVNINRGIVLQREYAEECTDPAKSYSLVEVLKQIND